MKEIKYKYVTYFLIVIVFAILGSCNSEINKTERADLLDYVDPFIGTDFHGHTFPGPVMPHGMVQVGPDTKLNGWDASSGYHYGDSIIYGFSHTHLSGTGIGDMGDFLLLPFTGELEEKPIAVFENCFNELNLFDNMTRSCWFNTWM